MYLNKAQTSLDRRRRLHHDSPGKSGDVESPILKESPSRANVQELSITPKKIYLNKALSSLEERRRKQNALMEKDNTLKKHEANSAKVFSGVPNEDSIIHKMHKLSAEVSDTISPRRRNTKDATGEALLSKNDAPTTRNDDPAVERGRTKYRRSHSLSRVPIPPSQVYDKVKDQNNQDQISTSSSSSDLSNQTVKGYNRTRSLSRLREEKRKADQGTYDLKPADSDLSNQTTSLYPNGENTSKRAAELEKQLEKVKSQLEMERRSRSHDINRLERQTNELLQKLNVMEKEKVESVERVVSKDEKINLLREQNNDLKRLVGDLQRQSRESGEQVALLEQQVAKANNDYRSNVELLKTKFEKREKEFELSHEEGQKANESLRNQLDLLNKMLKQRDNDLKQVKDKSSGLENETTELLEENEALHNKLGQLEDEMNEKSNEIMEYENALEKSLEEKKDLIKKMQSMELNFQRKEDKIKKSVENQLSSLKKDVVKVVGTLKQEKLQKDNQITLLNKTIEDHQQKSEMINKKLMEYKEKAQDLSETCGKMEKKLEKYQLKNQLLEEQIMESKEKNQALKEAQEKMKKWFENELSLQQKKFEEVTKETTETLNIREEQLRKKMQEKLDDELRLKNMQVQDLQREAEKNYAAKEEDLRAVFNAQIEKLQTFLEDEVSKAEEEGKRSLEEARKAWLQELEARLKHQDEMNMEKHSELQNKTKKLKSELYSKDTLIQQLKEELKIKLFALHEKEESCNMLSKQIDAKETEISVIRGEKAEIQAREEKLSVEHMLELRSLREAIIRLEEKKCSLEALSQLEGEKSAEIQSLNDKLEEKQSLLETLKRNELAMYRAIEEKDHMIQCLAERLETNQLAVESLTLSLEAKVQEISGIKSQLEENVSNETKAAEVESRLKTLYEEKLSFFQAERHSAIQLLKKELENVQQQMKSLSASIELKDQKLDEYVAEINYLKSCYEIPNVSGSLLKPDNSEEMKLLQEDKRKLEYYIVKLQETVKTFQQQHETGNQEAHKFKDTINPHESIDQLLEHVPFNVVLNCLRARISGQKPRLSDPEQQNLLHAPNEQEPGDAVDSKRYSTMQSFDSAALEKSKTAKDACDAESNFAAGISTVLSSISATASETLKTPMGACHTMNIFPIGSSTVLNVTEAQNSLNRDIKRNFSLSNIAVDSIESTALEKSKTPLDACNAEHNFVIDISTSTALSSSSTAASETPKSPKTPKDICHPSSKFSTDIGTDLGSNSAASDVSKTISSYYDSKNDFSLGVNMIQSSDSATSEVSKTYIYDSRNIRDSSKEKFMTAITPKAKPRNTKELFTITPKTKLAGTEVVEEKIRSALELWEQVQTLSLSFEPDDSTACVTAYCGDESIQSAQLWGEKPLNMDEGNSKCISNYGCDETATLGDNNSLGIKTIRSSDSAFSDCTFESHSIAVKQFISRSKAIENLEDLLETESTPTNEISIDNVEDKLRTTIARWENIQASYQSDQNNMDIVVARGELHSDIRQWENNPTPYYPDQNGDIEVVVKGTDGDSVGFYSCLLSGSTMDKSIMAEDNSFVSFDIESIAKS